MIGTEINQNVKRDEVEVLVREMMEEDIKCMALEWKKKAEAATHIGGSSYNNLKNRFINGVLYDPLKIVHMYIIYSRQTDETNLIFCFGVFRTSGITRRWVCFLLAIINAAFLSYFLCINY